MKIYPNFTTEQLKAWLRSTDFTGNADAVVAEIARRETANKWAVADNVFDSDPYGIHEERRRNP
jgi:hypothetical protein